MSDEIYRVDPAPDAPLKSLPRGLAPDWLDDILRPVTPSDLMVASLQCLVLDVFERRDDA